MARGTRDGRIVKSKFLIKVDFKIKQYNPSVTSCQPQAERELNRLSFNGAKFAKSSLNLLLIPLGINTLVCLDFSKFNLQNRR